MKIQNQQNHYGVERKKEEKSFKDIIGYGLCIGIVVIGLIFYIYPSIKAVNIIYDLEQQKIKRDKLVKKNKFLKLEVSSLRRLSRIDKIAKNKLRMSVPERNQLVYVND